MTVYNQGMSEQWKIDQLAKVVEQALQVTDYGGQGSARVRSVPDPRTIRYYTTLGLLDRPAEMRGRTAHYGRRHVLQLVAIKKLQARGLSLVEVQQSLAGADDRTLQRWVGLPGDFWKRAAIAAAVKGRSSKAQVGSVERLLSRGPSSDDESADAKRPRRTRFWEAMPEEVEGVGPVDGNAPSSGESVSACTAVHLVISPGVKLVIEGIDFRDISQEVLNELTRASGDLQAALRRTGLASGEHSPSGKVDQ
jgi:DNA-binding transcriptional MerR regulator